MKLTLVFFIACVAFGVNGKKGFKKPSAVEKPACDNRQIACSYCLDTVTFFKEVAENKDVESAIVVYMKVICDFMNDTSPEYRQCVQYIDTVPGRMQMAIAAMTANPKYLCRFVCDSLGPITDDCISKPSSKKVSPLLKQTDDSMACEVCRSVPVALQQVLNSKGFTDSFVKYMLINCDIISPGPEKEECILRTNYLSLKIRYFAAEFLNPDTGCKFLC